MSDVLDCIIGSSWYIGSKTFPTAIQNISKQKKNVSIIFGHTGKFLKKLILFYLIKAEYQY